MMPTNELLKHHGIYYITGEIEAGGLLEIQQDILIKHLDPNWKDDVQLIINSPGGESCEGWALVDLLDWVKMDVKTVGIGQVCSLGAILVACGTPGKRALTRNSSMMIHGASTYGVGGNVQQLATHMKDMEIEFEKSLRFWSEHSKYKTKEEVKSVFLNGLDVYLTPEDAVGHGVIDVIINQKIIPKPRKK
jgi:ATP-dependent Clp protease protease subunit